MPLLVWVPTVVGQKRWKDYESQYLGEANKQPLNLDFFIWQTFLSIIEMNLLLRLWSIKPHLGSKNSPSLYFYFRTYFGCYLMQRIICQTNKRKYSQGVNDKLNAWTGKWLLNRKLDGSLWCEIMWNRSKFCVMLLTSFCLEEMFAEQSIYGINDLLKLPVYLTYRTIFLLCVFECQDARSITTYLKTPHCFGKLFCWRWFGNEWAYDDFTLKWKKRFNTLWECLLINFLLKTTLSTTFSPFLFLTVDFIHGHGQGNLPSCPGLVKIVVNFLHRVCTMLQFICTFTLS